jgi:hypothetical protein
MVFASMQKGLASEDKDEALAFHIPKLSCLSFSSKKMLNLHGQA